jgi:hypothetical protein
MATAFRYLTSILFVAVVLQFAFAGYGVFYAEHKVDNHQSVTKAAFDHGFDRHVVTGSVLLAVLLALVIAAFAGRLGSTAVTFSVGLLVAGILQIPLADLGRSVPALGFLHVLNGLAIYAAAGLLAHRSWTTRSAPPLPPPTAA